MRHDHLKKPAPLRFGKGCASCCRREEVEKEKRKVSSNDLKVHTGRFAVGREATDKGRGEDVV